MTWLMTLALACLAPAEATETDAEDCLRTKVQEGQTQGWRLRTTFTTTLADGAYKPYEMLLYAGSQYRFQACADANARNVNLIVYAADGTTVVTRDDTRNREPVVAFTPEATGSYYLMVYLQQAASPESSAAIATAIAHHH